MDVAQQLAGRLAALGWPDDAGGRFAAAARGHNLVAELPPSPAWCSPLLAAVLQHAASSAVRTLILAAPAMLAEWTATVGALIDGTAIRASTAPDRDAHVLIATPGGALALHQQSQLHPDEIGAVVFAWAEAWDDDDALAAVLQDMPREAQRIVITTRIDQPASQALMERYARKAATVPMVRGEEAGPRALPATVIASPWRARAQRVAGFAHRVPQRPLAIWTADTRDHAIIRHAFGSLPGDVSVNTTIPAAARCVLYYDLPTPAVMQTADAAAQAALLVPPGTDPYVARIAPRQTPLDLSGFADGMHERDHARRAEIVAAIGRHELAGAFYALSPLFEEHDPQQVAAALYALWTRTGTATAPTQPTHAPAPARRAEPAALVKLWVGAGKKDDATVADLVAILVREVGMDRADIGRIELRDTFALVEVPAPDADAIALRLTGLTLRRRKLLARVDSRRAAQRGGP